MRIVEELLDNLYTTNDDITSYKFVFQFIEKNFVEFQLNPIDNLLSTIELNKINNQVAIAILRSTFRARDHLESWNLCYNKVESLLNENGKDTKRLLRGLKPQQMLEV